MNCEFLLSYYFNKNKMQLTSIDYEIMNLLLKLSDEHKIRVKNIIEIIK